MWYIGSEVLVLDIYHSAVSTMDMIMNSPLEVELTAAFKGHMTPNVMIQYGHPSNPKYRFRTHKDVLFNCSATFKGKFNSRELVSQLNYHFLFSYM